MPAIPSKASFTGSTVTQGQFKTALDSLNDYLTGLAGLRRDTATARTALGVINATAPTYAQSDCRARLYATATRWYWGIGHLAHQREW
jgi:hypothetical protein